MLTLENDQRWMDAVLILVLVGTVAVVAMLTELVLLSETADEIGLAFEVLVVAVTVVANVVALVHEQAFVKVTAVDDDDVVVAVAATVAAIVVAAAVAAVIETGFGLEGLLGVNFAQQF